MKALGWIVTLIGGYFVFSSFKKSETVPNTETDTNYSPYKTGTVNKDLVITIDYYPPGKSQYTSASQKLPAGTKVQVSKLSKGMYTLIFNDYGTAQVSQSSITFEKTYDAADIIDAVTGNQGDKIVSSSDKLPENVYTPFNPFKMGVAKVAIPGVNSFPYLNPGDPVRVLASAKIYARNSKGEVVSTDNYEIESSNQQKRYVQQISITINEVTIATGNFEAFYGSDKYNPPKTGLTNKATKLYDKLGNEMALVAQTPVQVLGKGYVRTNKFGAYTNVNVYAVTYNGKAGFILQVDLIVN